MTPVQSDPVQFDPVQFKAQQRANWNALSSGWESWQDAFERGAAVVTAQLLELGGVRPGHAVLDVGTGLGEPAVSAARLVGPDGRVVGVDLAPDMIAAARRRAVGLANIEFAVGDLESLDLPPGPFDVVLSRWGLMFAVDHVAAFTTLARTLAPGGVLAAAVWGPAAPVISLGFQVIGSRLALPPPPAGLPGPFSMAEPGPLAAALAAAGFVDVSVTSTEVAFDFDSVAEFVAFSRALIPLMLRAKMRERFGSENDPASWAALGEAAGRFQSGDGVRIPSTVLLLHGVKPAG